jgi:hypothetical protein
MWLIVTTVVRAEAAARKALLDAKDIMRENRTRKNSSKNTSESSQLLVIVWCIAKPFLAHKVGKAVVAGAAGPAGVAAAKKKRKKRNW